MKMKKNEFIRIAGLLNRKLDIVPLLFGSLGLEQRLNRDLSADDIDVLIPEIFLNEKWGSIVELMNNAGYTLRDLHEHEFEKSGLRVAFAAIESLAPFAGIDLKQIPVIKEDGVCYYLPDLHDYLKVYKASAKDGYRKNVKNKKDNEKIELINNELRKHKEAKRMSELLYQGHASFRLTLGTGEVIYIDPFAGEGYDKEADLIIVTHQHPDHNKIDMVPRAKGCVIFQNSDAITKDGYKTLDFAGVIIEPTQAYNKNHDINECVGYLVTLGGKTLYFAGDTSKTAQMAELKNRNIDYAFLPIDGYFNMGIPEAIECAELIGAKHTVPIHMAPGKLFDREKAERFTAPSALIVEAGEVIEI